MYRFASLLLLTLLLIPLVANAGESRQCAHSQPRNLQLDLGGVDIIEFDVGANTLDISASSSARPIVDGRACASDEKLLDKMTLLQEKKGNKLVVRMLRDEKDDGSANSQANMSGKMFNAYRYFVLTASVPDTLMVMAKVGSGDVSVAGARTASVQVGSGDAKASNIQGRLTASVGSGDLGASDVGDLEMLSIGSGDADITHVRGAANVGSIGSGDLMLRDVDASVNLDSIGSGDAHLKQIGGDVTVGSVGSGDLDVDGVKGNLSVRSVNSGDVKHRDVSGKVDVPELD